MKSPKKILIIKLGALGDVVHTTIIISAIKKKYPECQIHYLTGDFISSIFEGDSNIDKVYRWDPNFKGMKQLLLLAKELFPQRYDAVFNLTHSIKTYLLSFLLLPKCVVSKKDFHKSWVENYFLTAKCKFKKLELPDKLYLSVGKKELQDVFEQIKDCPRPYIAISPAGFADKIREGRTWNIKKWQVLVDSLKSEFGGTVFVCGSMEEAEAHSILNNVELYSGKLEIRESIALLSLMDLVISGDTGLAHIAVAVDRKVIMLTGSTSPDKIAPYGKNGYCVDSQYICKHCWEKHCKHELVDGVYTPCMEEIPPQRVMDLILNEKLLRD